MSHRDGHRRKFFILKYPLDAKAIPSMLLRVVGDKYNPSASYAAPGTFLPAILAQGAEHSEASVEGPPLLPAPTLTLNRRECFEAARTKGAKLKLARLLHLEGDRNHEERIEMESAVVKRYSLDNAPAQFRALMARDVGYAREVRGVLARKREGSRRAYLVDGFMTAEDATWSRGTKRGFSSGLGVTIVPPLEGVVAAGLEVEAHVSLSRHVGRESAWMAPGEEIFAVSYLEVKLAGEGFLGTGPKTVVVGDTVVASNLTAALAGSGSGREVSKAEEETEEETDGESSGDESEEEVEEDDVEVVVLNGLDPQVLEGLEHFLEI
ncbi:hypothetical protein QBC39DRAFT_182641 [Podospora conica]|nr:hypothetical protein QBC39DRAFT_182641 [Schizothecium conicum]